MNKWLKILLVLLSFALISILLFLLLKHLNITNISSLREVVSKSGKYAMVVYTMILIFVLVAFCFIPLINTSLAIMGIALFGAKIAFISNMIAIFFSTTILFYIGDFFGEKLAIKLLGKKTFTETQNIIDHKSKFWLPILFLAPGIPDEALCIIAGMTKIKYWYLMLVSLVYHAIEIGIFCFIGSGLINWNALNLLDWIILSNIVLFDLILLIKFEKYLDKKIK